MYKGKAVKALVAALFMAGLFYGCSKKETPTSTTIHDTTTIYDTTVVHDTTTINVTKMALCFVYNSDCVVDIVSDPTPDYSLSNAALSWGNGPTTLLFKEKVQRSGWVALYLDIYDTLGYTHQFGDTVLTLNVNSNIGSCQGTIQVPENTNITSPSDYDTVAIGSVTCTWANSARAEWYGVYYYAVACSADSWNLLEEKYTPTTGSSIIIPASYFNYPGTQYYIVGVGVSPFCGPLAQVGATGNMSGTIKGFLISEGGSSYIDFYVGTPPKNAKLPKIEKLEPSRQERMNKYLKVVAGN